ncbi:MAG: hypothetical protein AAF242_11845 [Bacteroidota bacterium]
MNYPKLFFTFLFILTLSSAAIASNNYYFELTPVTGDTVKLSIDFNDINQNNVDIISKKFTKLLKKLDNKKIYKLEVKANLPNPFAEDQEKMEITISTAGTGKELRDDVGLAWEELVKELRE